MYYYFLYSVGLLGSSHIMELDLRGEVLRNESSETTVPQNSSNLHKEVKMARLHQQIHFYTSFAIVNTIR